ncbi:hypothetical protein V8F20_009376 [Naviculisporaceae sp. PSN 640]
MCEIEEVGPETEWKTLGVSLQEALGRGKFTAATVTMFETDGETHSCLNLSDTELAIKLQQIKDEDALGFQGKPGVERTLFLDQSDGDYLRLRVSQAGFENICKVFHIPPIFVESIFETGWNVHRAGQGLFTKNEGSITIFYRFLYDSAKDIRAFIFTHYDLVSQRSYTLCINMFESVRIRWTSTVGQYRARQGNRSPLALHILLLYESLNRLDKEGTTQRDRLLDYEWGGRLEATNHKTAIAELHRLSQLIQMLSEDLGDIQRRISLLLEASEAFQRMQSKTALSTMRHDHGLLKALQRRCEISRSWLLNYRDRTNIKINLVFHASTVQLAEDSFQDSSSVTTISVMTLFFLPGTFICSFFSMVFFQLAATDTLMVSSNLWYYFAVAAPLTAIVMAWWLRWKQQRLKQRRQIQPLPYSLPPSPSKDSLPLLRTHTAPRCEFQLSLPVLSTRGYRRRRQK